jgi:hypothetical protein
MLKIQQQLRADERRGAGKAHSGNNRLHAQSALATFIDFVEAAADAQSHAVADLDFEALCRALAEDQLIALQRAEFAGQQRVVGRGRDHFDVVDKAPTLAKQVGLGIQRAGLANRKANLGPLLQALQPGLVVMAAAEHLHFEVARVAEQFLLQLADYPMLEAEQQQQRRDHRHQRRGHAQRHVAVMPEVGQRQPDQQRQALIPRVQNGSPPGH